MAGVPKMRSGPSQALVAIALSHLRQKKIIDLDDLLTWGTSDLDLNHLNFKIGQDLEDLP